MASLSIAVTKREGSDCWCAEAKRLPGMISVEKFAQVSIFMCVDETVY